MTDPVELRARGGVKIDKPRLLDFGGPLVPPLGGEVQHLHRLGTRHAIDITLPTMRTEPDGREWAADLSRAKLYGAIVRFRQDGLKLGVPGEPVVDGADQYGSAIALRGFTPKYVMRYGQALSLLVAGQWYLYFAADLTMAGLDGTMLLPIYPMLRKSPADGDTAEVYAPRLQGSLSGNEFSWTRLTSPFTDIGTITISEDG